MNFEFHVKQKIGNCYWWIYGLTRSQYALPDDVKSLLFVCKGNVCRSVFAQFLAEKMARETGITNAVFDSAGLQVSHAFSPPLEAITVASEFGVNIGSHRSKRITPKMVESYDIVMAMEAQQLTVLKRVFAYRRDRLFLLPLYDGDQGDIRDRYSLYNIKDPFGKDRTEFRNCYQRIEKCLASLLGRLSWRK